MSQMLQKDRQVCQRKLLVVYLKEIFVARVRDALSVLGYDSTSYAGHSFRIGAATAAADRGIEDSIIKILGRWESSAYQLYVRSSQQTLKSVSKRLVAPVPHAQ